MPAFDEDEVRHKIAAGAISAVALDTSRIEAYARSGNLQHPMLRGLSELAARDVPVLVPDVVADELRRHLRKAMTETRENLDRNLAKSLKHLPEIAEAARAFSEAIPSADQIVSLADTNLEEFFGRISATVLLSEEWADIRQILQRYNDQLPPFGSKGKKFEFPDAFALTAIENWARANGEVMAISGDGDWRSYCEQSDYVTCAPDLGKTISLFREDEEIVSRFLLKLTNVPAEEDDLEVQLYSEVEALLDQLDFSVDAYGNEMVAAEPTAANLIGLSRTDDAPRIIASDADTVAVALRYLAEIDIDADITFYAYDPIDRDEVMIGSQSESRTIEHAFELTFTLTGKGTQAVEVTSIAVSPETTLKQADFGWVSFDGFGDDEK